MQLLFHIYEPKPRDLEWLYQNKYSVDTEGWLDCTRWADAFHKDDTLSFCSLMQEITSVDLIFDKWKIEF